jgi:hypothetical protein
MLNNKKVVDTSIVRELYNKYLGTPEHINYKLANYAKIDNKWVFTGYNVPDKYCTIKKVKGNYYLMAIESDVFGNDERWLLDDFIKNLLGVC